MLLANFVFAPLVMILMLYFAPFDPALKTGLLVFCLCAGAPFLIKLTQTAKHNVALGAAVMKAPNRPMAVAVGSDGALYVSDDVKGRIWRITYVV